MENFDLERQLDELLNEEEPYIDDTGFTRSMLDKLPPARSRPEWLKPAVLITSTVLASTLAVVFLPDSSVMTTKISRFADIGVLWMGIIVTAAMVGVSFLSIAIARSDP